MTVFQEVYIYIYICKPNNRTNEVFNITTERGRLKQQYLYIKKDIMIDLRVVQEIMISRSF